MWASSRVFTDAPPLDVEKWLSGKPETDGKFVVIEFWRTWCGACKRMTPLMNTLQKKFGGELAVIGITGESEESVKAYKGPKKEYFLALDRPLPKEDQVVVTPEPSKNVGDGPDTAAPQSITVHPDQGRYEAQFGVWGWPHVVILEPQYRTVIWEGFPGLKGYELTEAKVEKILAIGRQGTK
jgi:thiol-disulfide isomerase/thioredoxin